VITPRPSLTPLISEHPLYSDATNGLSKALGCPLAAFPRCHLAVVELEAGRQ
jgi:hypothetical protein